MSILENLNKRLQYYDKCESYSKATNEDIERLKNFASIELPKDYINFLKEGMNISFAIDDGYPTFECWDISQILEQRTDFPFLEKKLPNSLVIGTDMGDWFFFYGHGREGFGLYLDESGSVSYESAVKFADTITEFMVNGVGIDVWADCM